MEPFSLGSISATGPSQSSNGKTHAHDDLKGNLLDKRNVSALVGQHSGGTRIA